MREGVGELLHLDAGLGAEPVGAAGDLGARVLDTSSLAVRGGCACARPREAGKSGELTYLFPRQQDAPGGARRVRPLGDLVERRLSCRRIERAQREPDLVEGAQARPRLFIPG